jgi:general stress protein 26
MNMTLKEKIIQVITGSHVAAVATLSEGKPEVRFIVLEGQPDLSLVGATMKATRKVQQIRKNPVVGISIWSGKEYSDPYIVFRGKAEIHEDLQTKTKYWNPMYEMFFKSVDNPDYVVIRFIPGEIEYIGPGMQPEIWKP